MSRRRKSVVAEPPTGVGSATAPVPLLVRVPHPDRRCGICGSMDDLVPMGPNSHPLAGWCSTCDSVPHPVT